METCITDGQAIDDDKIQGMRFACWVTKATHTYTQTQTHTHYEYAIVIGFPREQQSC